MHGHRLQPLAGLIWNWAKYLIWTQGVTTQGWITFVSFRYIVFNTDMVWDQKTHLIQLSCQDKPENPEFPLTNENLFEVDERDKINTKAWQKKEGKWGKGRRNGAREKGRKEKEKESRRERKKKTNWGDEGLTLCWARWPHGCIRFLPNPWNRTPSRWHWRMRLRVVTHLYASRVNQTTDVNPTDRGK